MAEERQTVRSMDDLAALMAANREQMREGKPDTPPNQVDDDPDEEEENATVEAAAADDEGVSQPDDGTEVEGEEDPVVDAAAEDTDPDASDDADPEAELAEPEFEISDDDLIEIEGLEDPVSFQALKEVYQADKTVTEKVAKTNEVLDSVSTTYRTAIEEAQQINGVITNVVQGLDQVIAAPLVEPPNEAMKQSNPAQYIAHLEAFNADQKRIAETKDAVVNAMKHHREQAEEAHKKLQEHEVKRLERSLTELQNPATKKAASKDILDAAAHFGFKPEEVQKAADHRVFRMAYYAQQYLKLKGLSAEEKEERTTTITRRVASQQPRVLRSKNSKPRQSAKAKEVKTIKNRAAKSGKPQDVAAFMGANRQRPQ